MKIKYRIGDKITATIFRQYTSSSYSGRVVGFTKNGRIKVLSDYGHGYMIKVDPFLKSGGKISIIK